MKKAVLFFGLVISLAVVGSAQVRTVTNSSLQKFQEKRLAAERDYRDNYARLGFPSPEELDRQREADMAARLELADQLRQARLEKERLELDGRSLDIQAMVIENQALDSSYEGPSRYFSGGYGGFFGGFGGFDGRFGARRRHSGGFFNDGGYRATPVGVYPNRSPRVRGILSGGGRRGGAIFRTGRR